MGRRHFWLSFADIDRPQGTRFLGAVVTAAETMFEAIVKAEALGINPGGEVHGTGFDNLVIPMHYVDRLLSRTECEYLDALFDGRLQ